MAPIPVTGSRFTEPQRLPEQQPNQTQQEQQPQEKEDPLFLPVAEFLEYDERLISLRKALNALWTNHRNQNDDDNEDEPSNHLDHHKVVNPEQKNANDGNDLPQPQRTMMTKKKKKWKNKHELRSQMVQLIRNYSTTCACATTSTAVTTAAVGSTVTSNYIPLSSWSSWPFQEQVDLHLWIPALNAMDAVVRHAMKTYRHLLLLPPIPRTNAGATAGNYPFSRQLPSDPIANDENDDDGDTSDVPPETVAVSELVVVLQFWSSLLRNGYSKAVVNSIYEWTDLLASSHDVLVQAALQCIYAWMMPCQSHLHVGLAASMEPSTHGAASPPPTTTTSATAAHLFPSQLPTVTQVRCLALARAWGTRTHHLGLEQVVTADAAFLGTSSTAGSQSGSSPLGNTNVNHSTPMAWPEQPAHVHFVYTPDVTIHLDASELLARNSSFSSTYQDNSRMEVDYPVNGGGDGDDSAKKHRVGADGSSPSSFLFSLPQQQQQQPLEGSVEDEEDDDVEEEAQPSQQHRPKRRRVIPEMKSTAEIFAMAMEQLEQKKKEQERPSHPTSVGRATSVGESMLVEEEPDRNVESQKKQGTNGDSSSQVQQQPHDDRLFSLLADIRLARSYRYQVLPAVELRLQALITLLQQAASPASTLQQQEMVSGYFQAQPELVGELVDLLRPTVSATFIHPTHPPPTFSRHVHDRGGSSSSPVATSSRLFPNDAVAHLADHGQVIPFSIRLLALEALTALVIRRDSSSNNNHNNGSLEARFTSVLNELGVGKGLYMGVLPTLLRYSLAAITTTTTTTTSPSISNNHEAIEDVDMKTTTSTTQEEMAVMGNSYDNSEDDDVAMDIGIAFLEAIMGSEGPASPPPRWMQVEQALTWLDRLLQLTMAVASSPTGTSALTESGMVPALLSLVALDTHDTVQGLLLLPRTSSSSVLPAPTQPPWSNNHSNSDIANQIAAQLRFCTAQAVQILEALVGAQSNAAAAFNDLEGVPLLTERLSREMRACRRNNNNPKENSVTTSATTIENNGVGFSDNDGPSPSQRILLFALVTCLTMVFHQESNANTPTTASGAVSTNNGGNSGSSQGSNQLKQPALADAVRIILKQVSLYGGHLASLVATLLSDVLNHDPHMVHYVHEAGIAEVFFDMLNDNNSRRNNADGLSSSTFLPRLPPVPELIMSIPNVLSALALTEDGAKAVKKANPFPALCSIFYHPQYAMPASKCLLNELTAIVGTSLEEIMRHVEGVKPLVMAAIVEAMNRVVELGNDLSAKEAAVVQCPTVRRPGFTATRRLETERSCLIQYVLNMGQLLEQVLHNDDHVEPFCEAGGLTALLKLYQATFPKRWNFLVHVSSLSSIAVSNLHHSTIEESLTLALKCIFLKHDPIQLMEITAVETRQALSDLTQAEVNYRAGRKRPNTSNDDQGLIPLLPGICLYDLESDQEMTQIASVLECYAKVTWVGGNLALVLKAVGRRMDELMTLGVGGVTTTSSQAETLAEWRNYITSPTFVALMQDLAQVEQDAIWQVCQARAVQGAAEEQSMATTSTSTAFSTCRYRLRIVCPEGAVVRNGIEIDSCASVGSMEMGEVVEGIDRCINSSGILRYRTDRGWISEMTRGHGREPITEVIDVWKVSTTTKTKPSVSAEEQLHRIECNIPTIPQMAVGILARLQRTYGELFTSLSRLVVQGFRSMGTRSPVLEPGTQGGHVVAMLQTMLYEPLATALRRRPGKGEGGTGGSLDEAGTAMYYGCLLDQVLSCLFFEERRERRMVNVLLLAKLVGLDQAISYPPTSGSPSTCPNLMSAPLLDCIQYIWKHCLNDFEVRCDREDLKQSFSLAAGEEAIQRPPQRVGHSVAACFPPVIKFLRRLVSTPIASSPVATVMSRIKWKHLRQILSLSSVADADHDNADSQKKEDEGDNEFFQPEVLTKSVQLQISELVRQAWVDDRIALAPPHLLHPVLSLVGDVIVGLEEEASKKKNKTSSTSSSSSTSTTRGWDGGGRGWDGGSSLFPLSDWIRRSSRSGTNEAVPAPQPPPPPQAQQQASQPFVASEEAIARLEEMGFGRDHAIDALERTESNRIEVAMEYALLYPPPDPATAARRRAEREQLQAAEQQRGQAQQQQQQESESSSAVTAADPVIHDENENRNTSTAEAVIAGDSAAASNDMDPEDELNPGMATANEAVAATESTEENGRTPMDLDEAKDDEQEEDWKKKKEEEEEEFGDQQISAALQSWIELSPITCCNILASSKTPPSKISGPTLTAQPDGDAESEALSVVVTSFLLDLCHRYPDEKDNIVALLLGKLRAKLELCNNEEDDRIVAKLAHAVVLFIKALPKVRLVILKKGLVTPIVLRVESFIEDAMALKSEAIKWPMWLPHFLLLLDVMAQPIVAFTEEDYKQEESESICFDYFDVLADHQSQSDALANAMSEAFHILGKMSNQHSKEDEVSSNKPKPMPAYFPLLPLRYVDVCLKTCRRLIGCGKAEGNIASLPPPPGVLQAAMMLLLHLLRTPVASTECIREGVVEAILELRGESRFTGNSGLVTLIFRRLLEDESTLLAAMETEIRTTVSKLAKSNGETSTSTSSSNNKKDGEVVPLRAFIEAATPLLCRDASVFLKAMSQTLKIQGDLNAPDPKIALLPAEERTKKATTTAVTTSEQSSQHPTTDSPLKHASKARRSLSGSSGSPRRRSGSLKTSSRATAAINNTNSARRSKRETAELQREESVGTLSTPAALITYHLVGRILCVVEKSNEEEDGLSSQSPVAFLEQWELLGVLSDLILAVPACASSVHNYRPHRTKDKRYAYKMSHLVHALPVSPPPTKSFVNFLLHVVLAQDRWSLRNDEKVWSRGKREGSDDPVVVAKKKAAARVLKTSQAAARVLLALCARPGEGRRRIIADLTFALSGGHLGQDLLKQQTKQETSSTTVVSKKPGKEVHALYAWGELCLGLAVPRGGGKNLEASISINYEIVRLMFECGMVHALMYAAHIVPFDHEMASSTFGTLLLPLEILTRANVSNFVAEQVQKEGAGQSSAKADSEVQDPETQIDGTGSRGEYYVGPGPDGRGVDNVLYMSMDPDEENSAADDDEDEGGIMELEGEDEDEENESDDVESVEEEDEEGEEMSEEDEPSENEMSENDEEEDEEESDEVTSDEVDDEGDWNLDYEFAFGPENAPPADNDDGIIEDAAGEGQAAQHAIEEGWTRIESTGFGGMVLGGFTTRMGNGGDHEAEPARGFFDAAEAMIGTLLRSGEINQDSIAEIEGQLGIRLTGRRFRAPGGDPLGETAIATRLLSGRPTSQPSRNGDIVGTLPHVHQRSQPEAGYSSSFVGYGSGRLADISSIEIVFGGPSVTAGSRNYNIRASEPAESEEHQLPYISQMDLQLFPGGPASATIARAQHSLHPLLCGVDLPPINALVMDLFPHGVRARRTGQLHTRRPGDWTNSSFSPGGYLVSTATGNIIRSNRSHSGAALGSGLPSRAVSGPIGWTDDGLPFDATVEQLGTTLQAELTRSLREQFTATSTQSSNGEAHVDGSESGPPTSGNENAAETGNTVSVEVSMAVNASPANEETDTVPSGVREDDAPSTASEGEHVASSLASGLRLSSTSDDISGDVEETNNNDDDDNDAASEERPINNTEELDESPVEEAEEDHDGVAQNEVASEPPNRQESNESEETLVCPPNIEPDVFHSLPREMQRDVVNDHARSQDLAAQLDGTSLDPEVLAALPEEMRQEVIEQERRERMLHEQATSPADPSRAEEMDNASFIASLAPELRAEILVTADEETLSSLPPNLVAEANVLRERAAQERQRAVENSASRSAAAELRHRGISRGGVSAPSDGTSTVATRKKPRTGKFRVEADRETLIFMPENLTAPFAKCDVQLLLRLFFLLSPLRPPRLPHKIIQNLSAMPDLRLAFSTALLKLLHEDGKSITTALEAYAGTYCQDPCTWRSEMDRLFPVQDNFPPSSLLGVAPELTQFDDLDGFSSPVVKFKQGLGVAVSVVSNIPKITTGTVDSPELPPVVAARLIDALQQLCKSSPRFCAHALATKVALLSSCGEEKETTCLESIMDLIQKPRYLRSSSSLDQLLSLLESVVAPLSQLPRAGEEEDSISKKELDAAAAARKEWIDVPTVVVSPMRLQAFCSILRMESCRESAFMKVNMVLRRLCRLESNRRHVLAELASVAHSLGDDAVRDLKGLKIRMKEATISVGSNVSEDKQGKATPKSAGEKSMDSTGKISSSVTFSTSTSEIKLLRVLQTLQSMCSDIPDESHGKKGEGVYVTEELVHLLRQLDFGALWDELSSCLKIVQVLEGVATVTEGEEKASDEGEGQDEVSAEEDGTGNKKLRNSSAGILTRFLPSIEAFFVATASATKPKEIDKTKSTVGPREIPLENIVGAPRLIDFVSENRVLLNALVRNNAGLLDRGLRALVQVQRCRSVLDFDVKRHWFKTQVRRLRQYASRRHGNIRLHISRKTVFEEAYHQLRLRNADEMRGRLHITFRDEEGIDAGGLSREFFAILAKEMFNPNYALFTSTEDGCTFQPNPNSSINPDHLSYFRFCGRIVGKAVADGYLLDAHFTRSLYKHMLGIKPSHHDMEAIDPDYYRNLKTILEYNLEDIGLDLFFSIDDNSFGRRKVIDLIPNGRTIPVTEASKEEYVQLVCEHRMTTAIQNQIKAYLDGFYELVNPDLIAIFTPRELELVISGLPDIDVDDLRKNTEYIGWKVTDKEIQWFWNIMTTLTSNQKAAFLQFVTGSSKVPLAGFGELQGMRGVQKFSIHKVTKEIKGALMSAHTCFNSLDLPIYSSEEEMREKLLYAIHEGAGSFMFA